MNKMIIYSSKYGTTEKYAKELGTKKRYQFILIKKFQIPYFKRTKLFSLVPFIWGKYPALKNLLKNIIPLRANLR